MKKHTKKLEKKSTVFARFFVKILEVKMSNVEDQMMELEALESLFPNELRKLSATEFSLVGLVPFPDNSETNHVSVDIAFSFPPNYPSDAPVEWRIAKSTGCIATDSSCMENLAACIRAVCDENLGCSAVYQIAERVQEWLRANNEKEKSLHDLLQSKVSKAARTEGSEEYDSEEDSDYDSEFDDSELDPDYSSDDEEEEEQFEELQLKNLCSETDRVTVEEFMAWKKEYDAFLLKEGLIKRISAEDTRQTGKEQFQNLLKTRRGEGNVGEGEEFNEDLFGNEEDVDVDDLLDD